MKIPDSLKKVISSKVLKKAEVGDSKVSGLKELDNLSKNLSFLPNIAKDLNIARQNIFKLVKLEGGKPERASNVSAGKESKSPSPVFKDQSPMKKKEPKEESSFEMGQRFANFFLDLFNPKKLLAKISIGAIFMAAGIITLFKDAFLGLADYLSDAIQESFTKFVDYIGEWFKEVVKPIFAELTIFMEKIWTNIKDFFKPIFDWVGGKINSILEFLEPVFNFIGDVFGKIMVYVNKFKETLTSLSDTYNSIQNQISAARKSLAEASGPSSEVQYDAMGAVISDSGAQAAAEQAQKKETEEAKKKEEAAKAAAEAARKKKEADDAKAAAAAKAKAKADAAEKAKAAADAKSAAPNAVPTNFGKAVNPYEGQTKTSSQTNASQGGRGGPTAAEMAKKDLTPSQLKWLGDADPTDPYIMARMPPPQVGEKGGPPKAPTPAPAPVPTPAPTKPAPTKPAPAPSGGGMSDSKQMIMFHEGKGEKVPGGYKPYKDTRGYWTIGVGHLITKEKTLFVPKEWDRVFTEAEIMKMFDEDYAHHAAAAAKIPGFNLLGPAGQDALIDMTFNMGNYWAAKFPKAIAALAKGDFKTAADEFTDSDWYKQVKGRAATIVAIIRNSISATPVKGDTQSAKSPPTPAPTPAPAKPAPTPAKPEPAPKLPPTPADPPISGQKPGQKSFKDFFKLGAGETIAGLQPGLVERMTLMGEAFFKTTGTKLLVTSGYRSNEEQKKLYDEWVRGGEKGKVVSKPAAPLAGINGMSGRGSPHSKGTAIDINSQGPEGINRLAGPANKSTGFLEKFGLTRPVFAPNFQIGGKPITPDKDENWHIVAAGTPVGGPDGGVVPSKGGGEIDPSTGKNVTMPPPINDTGKNINSESTNIAADQRTQQKPTTPINIDASTTNNTQLTKNESGGNKNKPDTNKKLLERVT